MVPSMLPVRFVITYCDEPMVNWQTAGDAEGNRAVRSAPVIVQVLLGLALPFAAILVVRLTRLRSA